MFLPFVPKTITPILWKSMKMIVILGGQASQCVAIRTDSSSYVLSTSNIRRANDSVSDATIAGSTPKHQLEFIKKFTPVRIQFDNLDADLVPLACPISVTCMPARPTNILLCMTLEGNLCLQNFQLDSLQFNRHDSDGMSVGQFSHNVSITAQRETCQFLNISPATHADFLVQDGIAQNPGRFCRERVRCTSGQGWALIGIRGVDKLHLLYSSWDGSTERGGAYYEEVAVIECPSFNVTANITNMNYLDSVADRDKIECDQEQQVAIASLRLGVTEETNLAITMRSSVILDGFTSPYEKVLSWLCDQNDHFTAAIIALSLLDDKIALGDIENSMISGAYNQGLTNHERILESITPVHLHDIGTASKLANLNVKPVRLGSAMSYQEMLQKKVLTNLSNIAVNCLINGGSTMAHALDKFLARNKFYDADSACKILVENATRTIRNLDAVDMKHLAPYSYNPHQSEGHALWPIQCLLGVAVARDCMESALSMLNQNIPEELRHRPTNSHGSHYASTMQLSKSIISMILASTKDAGGVLMGLVDPSTNKLYWESLDGETQLSLSLLHVQGRFPLLREVEVRDWALNLLHGSTGLVNRESNEFEEDVPSDWLRELCTGVLSNAGCDLSQTILFTPAISIDPTDTINVDEKDLFHESLEEEEDLYDYLTPVPGFGGIDYDLIIPSFLILVKRKINWLVGNDKISSQKILNVICDLAGKPSIEEPIFSLNSSPVIKQCVIMENALAAANFIGGQKGLVLKCAYYLTQEFELGMSQAERILSQDADNASSIMCPISESVHGKMADVEFTLTESHKAILWLLEKHTLSVKKYGAFYSESRGHIDPVFAARLCLKVWLCFMKAYPGSGLWLEKWLVDRLDLDSSATPSKRLPHAAIIRALLWTETEGRSEAKRSELDRKPVLAMSLGFSMPFLVNLARIPCGLLECVPSSILPPTHVSSSDTVRPKS